MFKRTLVMLSALLVGCTSDNVIDKQENSAPTILIVSHSDAAEVQDGFVEYFRATVSDDDNEFSELSVAWYVGEDLVCDWTEASPAGDTTCEIVFQNGDGNVIAEVRDPQGAGGRFEVGVSVLPTEAPIVELLTPVSGDNYYSDGLIQFSALVSDAEDASVDLVVTWTSSVDGELSLDNSINASGEISDYTYLTEGNHAIELRVEDTTGKFSTEEVVIQVGGENTIPSCLITEPVDGSAVVVGEAVTFRASVDDPDIPNNELTVEWSSNRDGVFDTTPPTSSGNASFVYNGLNADNHTIILNVSDEVGAVCTEQIILSVGNPPLVAIDEPLDGEVYSIGETVTFRGTVSDSEDQSNQISVVWNSDVEGELQSGNANSQGVSQFTRSDLSAGVHSISFSATDSTGLMSDDLISFRVNTLPVVDSLVLSPDPVYSTSNLSATVSTTDADGQNVNTTIEWYEDGVLTSFIGTTINATELQVGEVWTVRATPNDGYQDGNYVEQTIIVSNTEPTIGTATISPSSGVNPNDLLTCFATATDLDDGSLTPLYTWTSSSGSISSGTTWQLNPSFVSGLDTITCTATAVDNNGASVSSTTSITVDNTPPVSTSISIIPNTAVTTGTQLTCAATFMDSEDGAIAPNYAWSIGGNSIANGPSYTVSAIDSNVGETIVCTATAVDSDGNQTSDTASVSIDNTPPTIVMNTISSNDGLYNDSILLCSATVTDPDETLTPSYEWSVQGVSLEYIDTFDLTTAQVAPMDTVVCTASVTDSQGAYTQDTDSVVLLNRAPTAPGISMSPTQPVEQIDAVTCSVDTPSIDPDGDAIVYTYTWMDTNQTIVQTTTQSTSTDILPASLVQAGDLTCEVLASDGSTTASSSTAIVVQTAGGQHAVLTGTPDPSTVFNNIEFTYYYPNNLVNSIWHGPSDTMVTGHMCGSGYWVHGATTGYSTSPTYGSPDYKRMVHTPKTELIFTSIGTWCNISRASSDLYVATMDSTGTIGTFQPVEFMDGYSGDCNLLSSSADQFMCFTGSEIRIYNTTAGSAQLTFDQSISISPSTIDVCTNSCYSGTFAWDGMYFYFTNGGTNMNNLSYTVFYSNGNIEGVYTALGNGAISGAYFDWSVGRYTTHDGWGYRGGGTSYVPSGGSASDDSQSYSYTSLAHSL